MLLRPLPVPNPGELVNLVGARAEAGLQLVQPGRQLRRGLQLPDVPRPRAGADQLHRALPPTGTSAPASATRAPRSAPRACWCRAATFRCSASTPPLGRLLTPDDDKTIGGHFVVGAQPRLLAHALRAEPGDPERDAGDQRPGDDGRRRRAARLQGHDARQQPRRVRAHHDARRHAARASTPSRIAAAIGRTSSAASSRASPMQQAGVAINGPYRAIINDVEKPLQKGMSEQTMARFESKTITLEPGAARPEQRGQRGAHAADRAAGRDRHRAADRLRQHRQPAAGARRRPRGGNGRAPVDWRQPPPADHAAADRVAAAGHRSARSPACSWRSGRST